MLGDFRADTGPAHVYTLLAATEPLNFQAWPRTYGEMLMYQGGFFPVPVEKTAATLFPVPSDPEFHAHSPGPNRSTIQVRERQNFQSLPCDPTHT